MKFITYSYLVGYRHLFFTGDFRSTLDDVDVFCADKFSGIERILYAYIRTFSALVILGYSSYYLLIGFNCFELFLLFIPLAGVLILTTWRVLIGDTSGFLHTVSAIFWGWIMTVFALSHAAWLLMLPATNTQGGALLVLFLLALTESNDIAQYLWGGNPRQKKKWSPKSAREKRWKVWWGA